MAEATDTLPQPLEPGLTLGLCARCGESVDVRGRHLAIEGRSVRVYCSERCATQPALPADVPEPSPAPPSPLRHIARIAATLPLLVFTSGPQRPPSSLLAAPLPLAVVAAAPAVPEPPRFGPAWPPTEQDWRSEIARDAWVHPLDGPMRRMPVRDGRVFGAERPGDRPGECRGGHCGVDLGGETWGEPIHAAHDGVVDRVQRGPNEDHGGLYVRIAHRNGTIFTQYFHLAAIPRSIQPGVHVKLGDVVGLLGDTGVKHSSAHLHFTVSVRPAALLPEQYIDPEPLIALWPMRMPLSGGAGSMVTASAAPGVPLGSAGGRRRASHHRPRPAGAIEVTDGAISE
jgi:hypothetical protein